MKNNIRFYEDLYKNLIRELNHNQHIKMVNKK